ncbi:MAG: hypothetical protein K6C14_02660 [Eubacterium sp.]|nr:hypothetical protein [Eubacterium sp.]
MSENNKLSIDEIIRRAEEIKAEAQRHIDSAEKSLSDKEKAKSEQKEIVIDEAEHEKRVADAVNFFEPEEDVKEYTPAKKEEVRAFIPRKKKEYKNENDDDIKIVPVPFENADGDAPAVSAADGKTKPVSLVEEEAAPAADDGKTKVVEEKTAVFVTSVTDDGGNEDGLEQIPTIVSKDALVSAFNAEAENDFEEESGVQITFEGFDEETDEVETVNEEDVERELEEKRRETIKNFRIFDPEKTDESLGSDSDIKTDFVDPDESESFIKTLIADKKKTRIRVLLTGIIGGILLILTELGAQSALPTAFSSPKLYYFAIVLYAAVMIINYNVFFRGLNLKKPRNFDLPVSVGAIIILVHTLALAVSGSFRIDNGVLLAAAGVYAMCMSQLGKLKMMSRIVDNFSFITSQGDKYTLENITNAVDAEIISRGMLDEEPRLKMSVKTDFPTHFLEISCKREPADRFSNRIFIADIILCAALFVAIEIITREYTTALNAAVCALAISLPCSALTLTNSQLCDISAQLKHYGSRVCGFEGAVMASDANAIVMEAADLFGKENCGLHGIKTFNDEKVDDAIINTAAVIIQTKSPLRYVFDDVIIGQQSILPPVTDVTYEERLGTSAWIYNKKVLVGTRELLRAHDVKPPEESFEMRFTRRGRKALYLAVDGKLIAMFIVSYSADKLLRRELRKLEKSDMCIIVKSADPYITEESLSELFDLPAGFIRVMNYSSARAYDKYSGMEVKDSPAYVVHSGTALGLLGAMRGAEIIVGSRGLISFLCTFGSIFGLTAIAVLSVLGAFTQISALGILIFQAIWTAFVYIVIKLKGLGL